jgi:hypothetical protein
VQRADAAPVEDVEVIDIRTAGRRRGVVGDLSPRPVDSHKLRHLSEGLEAPRGDAGR